MISPVWKALPGDGNPIPSFMCWKLLDKALTPGCRLLLRTRYGPVHGPLHYPPALVPAIPCPVLLACPISIRLRGGGLIPNQHKTGPFFYFT